MTIRLPAEFEPHHSTAMCWPARAELYGDLMDRAREAHARVAATIARHEPVTMIAGTSADARDAAARCGDGVSVIELELDDSWFRDTGPIYTLDGTEPVATTWIFNGWGGKYTPYHRDATLATRFAASQGHRTNPVSMVLEGGAITGDGAGTLVTTAQCLMHPNRNPALTRADIERHLSAALGTELVVWLPHGLAGDHDTDGHVDNVAAFTAPGRILLQGCDDPSSPDHERMEANRRWIEGSADARGAPISVTVIPVLPTAEVAGRTVPVPYLNLYIGNGFVLVPVCGHPADDEMTALIAAEFPDREVTALDVGAVLAAGGGGIHCITQQIPAGA